MVTTFKIVDFYKNNLIHNNNNNIRNDSFGFNIAGGYLTNIPATIFNVDHDIRNDKLCKIEEGDILVEINGINTRNLTIQEVIKQLRLSGNHVLLKLKSDPQYKCKFKELKNLNKQSLDDLQLHVSSASPKKHLSSSPFISRNTTTTTIKSKSLDDFNDTELQLSSTSPSLTSSSSTSSESPKSQNKNDSNLEQTTDNLTTPPSTPVTNTNPQLIFNIDIDDSIKKKIDEKLKNCTCESDNESNIYTPKAVDLPSAQRLAKRLFSLDGFKASDVVRHLAKKNEFSQQVAEEYLKLFNFQGLTLDAALRKFLKQFQLIGDAQEKERVLMYFAKHYVDSNETAFSDVDTCHTLTCAIMLLNTDLHDSIQNKMSLLEFIENLKGLNDGINFPDILLETLYNAIKNEPLECAPLEVEDIPFEERIPNGFNGNPFVSFPDPITAKEYKSGWLLRKCVIESDGKKAAFLKRSWKMFYASIRDMVLYLHKDDKNIKKNSFDNITNAIRIHHAYASVANDYKKKQFVFRLKTADWAEYLFQTTNTNELNEWINVINLVAAMFSAPALAQPVSSTKTFQRPLLPVSNTLFSLSEQCDYHRKTLRQFRDELEELELTKDDKDFDKEKHAYLIFEIQRYSTYLELLEEKLSIDLPKATNCQSSSTNVLFNESILNTNLNHNNHEIKNLLNGKKLISTSTTNNNNNSTFID